MLIALFGATLLGMLAGFIWYAPNLPTGKAWIKLTGMNTQKTKPTELQKIFGFMAFFAFLQAFITWRIISWWQPTLLLSALQLGMLVWLGFSLPSLAANYLFMKKPWNLLAIDAGYHLLSILLMFGFMFFVR